MVDYSASSSYVESYKQAIFAIVSVMVFVIVFACLEVLPVNFFYCAKWDDRIRTDILPMSRLDAGLMQA